MTLCGSVLLPSDGIPSPDGGLACMKYAENRILYMPKLWDSTEMTHTKMFKSFQRMDIKCSANILTD